MRKKQVEAYIPEALKALQACGIVTDKGMVPKEFKGYIASFGASIVTNGLLPAIAFFQDQGNANADRSNLMKSILYIISGDPSCTSLMNYVNDNKDDKEEVKEQIMAAAVALKLAMRTFQFTKKEVTDDASA